MDQDANAPQDDTREDTAREHTMSWPASDPRIPQPDDADPTVSKELGGAAPAVGPDSSR
jgi:hypothetical protein